MKKLIVVVILFFSATISAQAKLEKSVKKVTKQMTEVMSLDKEQSAKVYALQLETRKSIAEAKKENEGDEDGAKAKVKEINKAANKKMIAIVGADNMKKWAAHKKANKKKKKD